MVAITCPVGRFAQDLQATIAGLQAWRERVQLVGVWLGLDQQTVLISLLGEEKTHRIFFTKPVTLVGTHHGY